jgi:hypothetical protein
MITEGIFYFNIDDSQVDVYNIKYNPDNSSLFDIECIIDDTSFPKELMLTFIENLSLYNPIEKLAVSYEKKENLDWLLQTFHDYYNTISRGIYTNDIDDGKHSALSNKLNKRVGNTQ